MGLKMNKKISVIMGIYNCENTLEKALECIIGQTYSNWEVIMCDDCSSDDTVRIAQKYVVSFPDKFILLRNTVNHGLNYTLNKCLKRASGEFIARMDGDDLCSADRFEKEISVLEEHPEFAIVSSDMFFFDENGVWGKTTVKKYPEKKDFIKGTPFCHAACMVRKEAYITVNGYSTDSKLLRVEDYHLWVKMYYYGYRGVNIQEPLYSMRDDRNAQRRRKFRFRFNEAYVKWYAINVLNLNKIFCFYCLLPIIKGMLPGYLYRKLHKGRKNLFE